MYLVEDDELEGISVFRDEVARRVIRRHRQRLERLFPAVLVNEQLLILKEKLPNVYWIAIISVDGLVVNFDSDEGLEEDRVSAMNAATLSLGERISLEMRGGKYTFSIIQGKTGRQFQIGLDEDYVLGFGVRDNNGSIDSMLIILCQWWQPLLKTLGIDQEPAILR